MACGIFLHQGLNLGVSCIGRQILNHRATKEVLPYYIINVGTVSSDTLFFILDIG